ncbi:stage II sporulation protein R [Bacillus thermophilus]|uniref:Stage II sporulation protein R n=1 Tax=Siminovitchia thermophila TaxID=1245522 RepID=A0ABS2R4D7_9BACI|nr:stage II sporulation protein R [Siminovitchia thermophila]MBM7714482.1 stage II sporulation protein R [Siminovitchia thermophila]
MRKYMNQKFYQKNMAWLYMVVLSLATVANLAIPIPPEERAEAEEIQVIPQEAIRLRILANSDGHQDQEVKRSIRDAVNQEITTWVEHLTSIEEARRLIQSRLPEIEQIANRELEKSSIDYGAEVEFGNIQFPTKLYGNYLYPAGNYEAILITLGEGKGANWWCVLFPPLCFLDFSTGAAVNTNTDESADKSVQDVENGQNNALIAEQEKAENAESADFAEQEKVGKKESGAFAEQEEAGNAESADFAEQEETGKKESSAFVEEGEAGKKESGTFAEQEKAGKKESAAYIAEQEEETEVKFFLKELFDRF